MLILTRKQGQSIYIGDGVIVRVVEVKGHQVRLGIEAGKDIKIYREEIWQQIQEQNREAAVAPGSDMELEGLSSVWKGSGQPPKVGLAGVKLADLKAQTPQTTDPKVVLRKKRKKTDD